MIHGWKQAADWRQKVRLSKQFIAFVGCRFGEDRCVQYASSLAYTSLLSLVPLMAVIFTVLAAFPVFEQFSGGLQSFVFENFMPSSGEVVQGYLQTFSEKASSLTAVGIIGLVMTALLLMAAIDKAFNNIWRTRRKRSTLGSFMVYWAVLSLGPMLMGAGLALSSYVVSMPLFSDAANLGKGFGLLRTVPFMLSALAFTLIYSVVPHCRVPFKHALAGGVVAALLFEVAKKGFAFYVTNFPTYEAIYGAMASVPIFLVWIYLSWMVALFGAEVTQAFSSFHTSPDGKAPYDADFHLAYRCLGHLWLAQKRGESLSEKTLLQREAISHENLEVLLRLLEKAQYVHRTEMGEWLLARDLSQVTLLDLYQAHRFVLPETEVKAALSVDDDWDQSFYLRMQSLQPYLGEAMCDPLSTLYAENRTVM
ncbi:MAG: virulence factor BrkB family protein [Gammaproteobacteria bacterium]|nr:virulence factor BrkB family protein [Gammaproteobacteria bacterium]